MSVPPRKAASADALLEAQKLAFAPVAFQAAKVMRDRGIFAELAKAGCRGATVAVLEAATGTSEYALRTLLEAAETFGLVVRQQSGGYVITRTGLLIQYDPMTRVNMDFVHDVCWEGLARLGQSIEEGRPAGLGVFGDWETIYQALPELPEQTKKSWFGFDHFYSDVAFPQALRLIMESKPRRILDVGGNTGKFAILCCEASPDVRVTLCDLPGQLEAALAAAASRGLAERIDTCPIDLLDAKQPLPKGYDAVWMSQLLCCFSLEQIVDIIRRARSAMDPGAVLWILDTYWDRQIHAAARYCLHGTSLYFTTMANGCSRMYSAKDMLGCVEAAGLEVAAILDGLGLGHTLIRCRR